MFVLRFLAPRLFNTATEGSAPNGTPPAAAPPAAAPPAATPPAGAAPAGGEPAEIKFTSEALKQRLDEERSRAEKKFLKSLGFEKPEDLSTALKALKDLQSEKLSEKEKLEARIKELEPFQEQAKSYAAELEALANDQFEALPDAWKKAIDDVAAGKASERLRLIKSFKASGLLGAAAPSSGGEQQQQGGQPKPPAPKNLAPSGGTPAPKSQTPQSAFEKWAALRRENPVQGALFFQHNQAEIERTAPAEDQ